jgi:hypothetical protein
MGHPQAYGFVHYLDESLLDNHSFRVMHAKFMHELCSLLMHIPTYLDVMRYYNHDFN